MNILCFLLLSAVIACGSSSSNTTTVAEPFPEKVSIQEVTDLYVIFSVEVEDGRFELFSVNPVTGIRNGISDEFSPHNGLKPEGVSPNGTRIVYRADNDYNGSDELYSNLLDGSDENLLTTNIAMDNTGTTLHTNWQWLTDSSGVIFRSDTDNDGIFEIQTIDIDGNNLVTVSADLATRCFSSECWKMAGNSSSITFIVEAVSQNSEISQSLYSVASNGTNLIMLNQTLNTDSRIIDWQWSPDNSQIAYISQNIGEPAELYTVNPSTSNRVMLSNSGITDGVVDFAWAEDSIQLAFREDAITAGNLSLYKILSDGSGRTHLVDTFINANPTVLEWQWAPDASRIAYRADQETPGLFELFTVENDGNWHRRMNPPMLSSNTIYSDWQWAPLSDYVAFRGEFDTEQLDDELYSSAADGSAQSRVNIDLTGNGVLLMSDSWWSNDGSHLLYQISDATGRIEELYSVLADGTDNQSLNETLTAGQTLTGDYWLSSDSSQVLFQQSSSAGERSLQIADIDGNNRNNLRTAGVVSEPHWLNDDSRIVYVYLPSGGINQQLWSSLPSGEGKLRLY